MQIWQAIVLGAIQGFAEFLPVSSSGHLILAERWLGIEGGGLLFDVTLHVGTLIPLIILFRKDIRSLIVSPNKKSLYLCVATIPAVITGLLFGDKIESLFYGGDFTSALLVACSFALTAAVLFSAEKVQKTRTRSFPLDTSKAFVMGVCQGMAVIPGLSRSGTVISGGCFVGVNRNENANFAFLMSLPVIIGAAVLSLAKGITCGEVIEVFPMLAGIASAAVTGYIAIGVMLKAVKKADYKIFSAYLLFMAVASIVSKAVFDI